MRTKKKKMQNIKKKKKEKKQPNLTNNEWSLHSLLEINRLVSVDGYEYKIGMLKGDTLWNT